MLPDGPAAVPVQVPMFPVPLPGPVELGPVHGPPGAVPGFPAPSGLDPVALYPGPGVPPLQETDRLLPEARGQDAGGSAEGAVLRAEWSGFALEGGACRRNLSHPDLEEVGVGVPG